jgi:hypothetical protein
MVKDTFVLPTELDVLCGSGNAHHLGNRRFRRNVVGYHESYPFCVTKLDTMKISKMILIEVL